MLLALPIATWELSAGIYMAIKGFRNPSVANGDAPAVAAEPTVLVPA